MHGIQAVDAYGITEQSLTVASSILTIRDTRGRETEYDLREYRRIIVVGFGKAAGPMARAVERKLEKFNVGGIVITEYGYSLDLERINIHEAAHPIPDANSVTAAEDLVHMLQAIKEDDLIIVLISGGGSALFTLPHEPITLEDIQVVTRLLLNCGADIFEINTIRKHISRVKGGQLATSAYPTTLAALIISDVIDDRVDAIASGPTVPDPTTFQEAYDILSRYAILDETPQAIRDRIRLGIAGKIDDTPKSGDARFQKTMNMVIGHNLTALQAIARKAEGLGYRPLLISSRISGQTRTVAQVFSAMLKHIAASYRNEQPICIIAGGEMTVRVTGKGSGGRNQDFCLALVQLISGLDSVVILSAGTDGMDGPTDAAGAIIDNTTLNKAQRLGLNIEQALTDNDSYRFFKRSGDLLITGPTSTNVMDIQLALLYGVRSLL